MDKDALASGRFDCTEKERALFEAGIKMGTIYHQFVGTPFDLGSVGDLERAIAHSIEVQPYVEKADISISRDGLRNDRDTYSYKSLTGEMIDAVVTIRIGKTSVTAEMRYDEELRYPLMYVSNIHESA